eukprot:2189009-Rhodomonas_salina.1
MLGTVPFLRATTFLCMVLNCKCAECVQPESSWRGRAAPVRVLCGSLSCKGKDGGAAGGSDSEGEGWRQAKRRSNSCSVQCSAAGA